MTFEEKYLQEIKDRLQRTTAAADPETKSELEDIITDIDYTLQGLQRYEIIA